MSETTSRWTWGGVSIAAIWLAVAFMSIAAPDLVSGSEQSHLPLVALTSWIWALLATGFVVLAASFGRAVPRTAWRVYAAIAAVAWIAAAAVAALAPSFVTGTDPTTIPLTGLIAPIVALIVTGYASVAVVGLETEPKSIGQVIDRFAADVTR
jgi:hypothetical protein